MAATKSPTVGQSVVVLTDPVRDEQGIHFGGERQGVVLATAPFSVAVKLPDPSGIECVHWFIWRPGSAGHGKQHGQPPDHAMWLKEAWK